ncbi:WxL domain-containing protein [Vagococcus zengguangii]|uniref:WxL domain-containing protein n=1 Tax=Vagococcus zengguangii TaxID=2571750 RepID=A0A4D7CRJ6_9ENTE|nr:WxL domain-containing protein [Vagococcus zengguangii]QCI85464.1 WxL domain-containing protein [Vagococcus zengguangii]TLG80009.1 WxL domain-containing protein [Vagococcus zengguangii]
MKKISSCLAVIILTVSAFSTTQEGIAEENTEVFPKQSETKSDLTFEAGEGPNKPVDPESPDPTEPVEPKNPPGPGTSGALSIDYGSPLMFGSQHILPTDQTYYAYPDEMEGDSQKPTYVQVTDKRGTLAGWKLFVKQVTPFMTLAHEELVGAELSLTKASIASNVDLKYQPTIVEERVDLVVGEELPVVEAEPGTGLGTWVYRFGSNLSENAEAVQLFVPGKSVKLAKVYKTDLIWSLQDTPQNNRLN